MPESSSASSDPVRLLGERFRAAIGASFPQLGAGADPLIAASRPGMPADFQCNAAMPLGKALGMKPRDVAAAIVARVDLGDLAEPLSESSIAGPGFINITLRGESLARLLASLDTPDLGLPAASPAATVVVDLCGVNLAKQMHVGHLRSIIIGDALARTFERLGHRVVRQNHVGDWGLPIAMVADRLARAVAAGEVDPERLDLDGLERLYRAAQRECEADERGLAAVRRYGLGPKAQAELEEQVAGAREALARARAMLVRLQAHEPGAVAVWQRIADVTMRACLETCRRLHANVTAEHSAGESSYGQELGELVADLERRGIAEPSDGALVIRVEGFDEPCIVRKSDGGYLYATTDLAGIRRRVQKFGGSRVIYAVDARQALHFKLVFAAARKAGYDVLPDGTRASLEHAAFGMVLGDDGRPFKTRSGDNVKLSDLIDEAVERAERTMREKERERAGESPAADPVERRAIAEAIGIAAIKYADLSNDRTRDYVFNFDRMLAFEGNTGPYLLYALVRIRSIFRKGRERGVEFRPGAPLRLEHRAERALALALLRYPQAVRAVAETLEPHRLCQYLYDLAGAFSAFFDACPVLAAPDAATRDARLRLCDLTARVLADGLRTLGIRDLERM